MQQHTEHSMSSLVYTSLYHQHRDVTMDISYQSMQCNSTQILSNSTTQWANNARSRDHTQLTVISTLDVSVHKYAWEEEFTIIIIVYYAEAAENIKHTRL